jgi:hypothetical protein
VPGMAEFRRGLAMACRHGDERTCAVAPGRRILPVLDLPKSGGS